MGWPGWVGLVRGKLRDLISRQDQFADQIHKPVQKTNVDTNRLRCRVLRAGTLLDLQSRLDVLRRH